MIEREYIVGRKKQLEKTHNKYEQEISLLLTTAKKSFLDGKKSIILKLPNTSEEFYKELKKMAYDDYRFDTKKRLFGRVEIFRPYL